MARVELTPDDDPVEPVTLAVGDDLVVRLSEPATAGYAWEVADVGATLEPVDDTLAEPKSDGSARPVGGAPVRTFRFRPTAAGSGRVALVLRRPFEPDAAPARRLDLVLHVTDTLSKATDTPTDTDTSTDTDLGNDPTDQADRNNPPADPR